MPVENPFSSKNTSQIIKTRLLSDVDFILSDKSGAKIRIAAHKVVLAATSPVFNAMFCGKLKEGGDIHITDVSAEGFAEFIQLFYHSEVAFTVDNIAEVLRLIDKYDVPECFEARSRLLCGRPFPLRMFAFFSNWPHRFNCPIRESHNLKRCSNVIQRKRLSQRCSCQWERLLSEIFCGSMTSIVTRNLFLTRLSNGPNTS